MHRAQVTPTGVERVFGPDQIIVSKTDVKGRITYANSVFLDVARYCEADVLGQPHNIIRHPDMPRIVFKVLWDTVLAGEEIFAFVQNLASDGAHYWVLAHVTPSWTTAGRIGGFHSNRRLPSREAVASVGDLYRDLRAAERAHAKPADQMAASGALLDATLAARGLTYDAWVWSVINGTAAAA